MRSFSLKQFRMVIVILAMAVLASVSVGNQALAEETEEQLPFIPQEGFEALDPVARLLEVAVSQLGYVETADNRTKYSDWLNQPGSAWCSEFVAWCSMRAGIPSDVVPWCASYTAYRRVFSQKGRYYSVINGKDNDTCGCNTAAGGLSIPVEAIQPGDILLVSTNLGKYSSGPNHTVLCEFVEGTTVHTIEGNIGSDPKSVKRSTRKAEYIHGVCRPAYNSACTNGEAHLWINRSQLKQATCDEDGIVVEECKFCHMTRTTYQPKLGHKEKIIPGTKATCLQTGLTEGRVCERCGVVTVAQVVIPKIPLPKKGAFLVNGKNTAVFKVTKAGKSGGTVAYVSPIDQKQTSVTIQNTITVDGIKYKVTSISARAFYKCTSLKSVTIPSNVKKIGKLAFYGCKKLKKIKVKTTKLTKSRVGKYAFRKIYAKAVFDVPNSKKSTYKTIFQAKGAGKKTKYK